MRVLLVGAGGVGTALARIAARRGFAELIVADYDLGGRSGPRQPAAGTRRPFLDLLTEYGSPWACEERTPSGP